MLKARKTNIFIRTAALQNGREFFRSIITFPCGSAIIPLLFKVIIKTPFPFKYGRLLFQILGYCLQVGEI